MCASAAGPRPHKHRARWHRGADLRRERRPEHHRAADTAGAAVATADRHGVTGRGAVGGPAVESGWPHAFTDGARPPAPASPAAGGACAEPC